MTKWEQVNSQLADAQHYADDLKEDLDAAQKRIAELEAALAAVPVDAIRRVFGETYYAAETWVADVATVREWLAKREVQP